MHHVVPRIPGRPGSIRTPARLGEHDRALLAEIGGEGAAYEALVRTGLVCGVPPTP